MRHAIISAAAAIFLTLSAAGENSVRAATITWSPKQNVSAVSDISTKGTEVDGIYFGVSSGNPTVVANGVNFFPGVAAPNTTPAAGANQVSRTGAATDPIVLVIDNTVFNVGASPATGDPNYNTILSHLAYQNSGPATVFLNDLKPGDSYQFEIWADQPGNDNMNGNRADLTASGGPDLLATPGQFAIGTFLADSTTESFTFTSPGDANPIVNAIQLRDITTPEPSSLVAFCGLGAMGLFLFIRRQRKS